MSLWTELGIGSSYTLSMRKVGESFLFERSHRWLIKIPQCCHAVMATRLTHWRDTDWKKQDSTISQSLDILKWRIRQKIFTVLSSFSSGVVILSSTFFISISHPSFPLLNPATHSKSEVPDDMPSQANQEANIQRKKTSLTHAHKTCKLSCFFWTLVAKIKWRCSSHRRKEGWLIKTNQFVQRIEIDRLAEKPCAKNVLRSCSFYARISPVRISRIELCGKRNH